MKIGASCDTGTWKSHYEHMIRKSICIRIMPSSMVYLCTTVCRIQAQHTTVSLIFSF